MFCEKCGEKIDGSENFCPHCGQAKNESNSIMGELINTDRDEKQTNVFGIIVAITAFTIVLSIAIWGIYKGYESGKTQELPITTSPTNIQKQQYEQCEKESEDRAQDLLRSKIKTETNSYIRERYEKMDENNMFLKDDYDYFLENCFRKNGLK